MATETEIEFINESGLDFKDLSDEEYRIYTWDKDRKITIEKPLKLNVSASGGHRVFDASGTCHYIPAGWIHLEWFPKLGKAHFAF